MCVYHLIVIDAVTGAPPVGGPPFQSSKRVQSGTRVHGALPMAKTAKKAKAKAMAKPKPKLKPKLKAIIYIYIYICACVYIYTHMQIRVLAQLCVCEGDESVDGEEDTIFGVAAERGSVTVIAKGVTAECAHRMRRDASGSQASAA